MDFLSWLKTKIHHFKNKDFRKKIKDTKQKTYLFRDYEETFSSSRMSFFRKKKNLLLPFSYFFQRVDDIRTEHSKLLNLIGIALLVLSGYIIFFSSYFQITPSRVLIEGLDSSIDTNICYQAIDEIYGKNIFSIQKSEVFDTIKKYQKHASSIELDYLYPNSIKILVRAYPLNFKVSIYGLEKTWGLTSNGILIPLVKIGSQASDLLSLEIISPRLRDTLFLDYKNIVSEEVVSVIKRTLEIIASEFSDFKLAKTRYLEDEQELHITLESGIRIFLTLDSTLKNQLLALKNYAQANRDIFLKGDTIYVDARVTGKIFICKEKETCRMNIKNIYGDIYE